MIRKPTTTSGWSGSARRAVRQAEVGDLELAVAVGEGDELVAGGAEAGAECRAVAEVGRVVDGADDVRMGGRELVGDLGGPVLRAVVDGDDLELVGEGRQGRQGFRDEGLEVGLFVVRGEEVAELGDPGRRHERDCTCWTREDPGGVSAGVLATNGVLA